jgi:hypothetical protein
MANLNTQSTAGEPGPQVTSQVWPGSTSSNRKNRQSDVPASLFAFRRRFFPRRREEDRSCRRVARSLGLLMGPTLRGKSNFAGSHAPSIDFLTVAERQFGAQHGRCAVSGVDFISPWSDLTTR